MRPCEAPSLSAENLTKEALVEIDHGILCRAHNRRTDFFSHIIARSSEGLNRSRNHNDVERGNTAVMQYFQNFLKFHKCVVFRAVTGDSELDTLGREALVCEHPVSLPATVRLQ